MKKLIKAEFLRIYKDRVALLGLYISLILTVFTIGVNVIIQTILDVLVDDVGFSLSYGLNLFKSTFVADNGIGILMLIFGAIVLIRDFNQNTIRQKILAGHSRRNIYFSSIIVGFSYVLGVILINALINLGLGTILFGFSHLSTTDAALQLVYIIFIGLVSYSVYLMLALFFSFVTRSTGATIGIMIGVIFGLAILTGLVGVVALRNNWPDFILSFMPRAGQDLLAPFSVIELKPFLYSFFSGLVYIAGFMTFGYFVFKKIDIK